MTPTMTLMERNSMTMRRCRCDLVRAVFEARVLRNEALSPPPLLYSALDQPSLKLQLIEVVASKLSVHYY